MKTYILTVLQADCEDLVADILAALHKQGLIEYSEVTETTLTPPDTNGSTQELPLGQ